LTKGTANKPHPKRAIGLLATRTVLAYVRGPQTRRIEPEAGPLPSVILLKDLILERY
jgi:hypothetical protein